MRGAIPPLPQYDFMAWCLVKHRDNFTFTLPLDQGIYFHKQILERDKISKLEDACTKFVILETLTEIHCSHGQASQGHFDRSVH
jgi:hypothetical protein